MTTLTPLPNDCARCMNAAGCPLAKHCRRTTKGGGYTPIVDYPGGDGCYGFWPEEDLE